VEDRLIDLETRIGFQEHTIEQLNQVIVDQQKQLDRLALRLEQTEERMKSLQSSNIALPHEEAPPPHY
jgi:SlyX protein